MTLAPPTSATRHTPERSCVACRRKAPQDELLRLSKVVVAQQAGTGSEWQLSQGKSRQGRGVYLCNNPQCWQEKRLRRTFGAQAGRISEQLLSRMSAE